MLDFPILRLALHVCLLCSVSPDVLHFHLFYSHTFRDRFSFGLYTYLSTLHYDLCLQSSIPLLLSYYRTDRPGLVGVGRGMQSHRRPFQMRYSDAVSH
jgi:hypothetical protein